MVRSILLGVDGSHDNTGACKLGIRWARRFDALLVGLGIVDEPTICQPVMVPIGASYYKQHSDEVRIKRARAQVEQFLGQFALHCSEADIAYKLLEDVGLPCDQILLEAQRYDLILLGQQTHFHFATQQEPDDTLSKVLKNTPRPVVAVPRELPEGSAVLIAYDGSLQSARVLQAFQASGLAAGADSVHVLCVGDNAVEAGKHADRAIEFLGLHEIKAVRHVLPASPSTAEVILEQARRLGAGLLVMGCYGQPTLREFFLGSVTRSVLQQSVIPVFLYH